MTLYVLVRNAGGYGWDFINFYTSPTKALFWMNFGNKYFSKGKFDFYTVYPVKTKR